jgi:N-acetylglucosamine-6-phosphate deacetylase
MKICGINIFTQEAQELTISNSTIIHIRSLPYDSSLPFISPGFIDMQVNGYKGVDYSCEELTVKHIENIVSYLAASGTTQHVPTIITNSHERISQNVRIIAEATEKSEIVARAIPAIHIEGPFISEEDGPRGAHDWQFVRDPSTQELDDWIEQSNGLVKMVTIAPERKGSMEFIRHAVKRGIVVSIGHTNATKEDIENAIKCGAKCSTHLGNGSHAMVPRLKNYIWEQLASETLSAGLIADGFHLPDSVLSVFYKVKKRDLTILVSDVAFLGGAAPGNYRWGEVEVVVYPDGHIGLGNTPYLAGAGHLLDTCLANFATVTKEPLSNLIPLVTRNPISLLHLSLTKSLDLGSDADLTLLNWDGSRRPLDVQSTYILGREVYSK